MSVFSFCFGFVRLFCFVFLHVLMPSTLTGLVKKRDSP